MSKKNIFFLFLILILGILLRIWCLDKPQGLWNDEYISWFIASKKFPVEFFHEIIRNCHMPFYYIYLKSWMLLFSDSDLSLRFSSVVPGVACILTMFFVGRSYKDDKLGLVCALCTAVSGFLIYFSQEVRIYILVFLFTSLNLLSWVKLSKEQSVKNFIFFGLTNFMILITHTIGFVFVFFNILMLAVYLLSIDKKYIKHVKVLGFSLLLVTLSLSPFLYSIFKDSSGSQFWSGFSFGKIFFVTTDYFSPIQINIITTPKNISDILIKNSHLNYMFLIFAIIPTLLGITGVVKSLINKNKLNYCLAGVSVSFFFVLVVVAMLNKLVLITKYSVEIYPTIILLMCVGFLSFKKAFTRKILITLFILFSLTYTFVNNNSAPKLGRSEGNKQVADLITRAGMKKTDIILLTYYSSDKFEKYLPVKDYERLYSIDKYNFPDYLQPNIISHKDAVLKGKKLYYDNFKNNKQTYFDKKFIHEYINPLNKGDKLAIIVLKNVCFISKNKMTQVALNPEEYNKTPLMFLVFSYIKNNSIDLASKYLKPDAIYESGDWVIVVFEKK